MKIKCGRKEYELNKHDVIFFNGACYMIMTREEGDLYRKYSPIVAKAKAKQLIKEGLFKEVTLSNPPYYGDSYKYYKIS